MKLEEVVPLAMRLVLRLLVLNKGRDMHLVISKVTDDIYITNDSYSKICKNRIIMS